MVKLPPVDFSNEIAALQLVAARLRNSAEYAGLDLEEVAAEIESAASTLLVNSTKTHTQPGLDDLDGYRLGRGAKEVQ